MFNFFHFQRRSRISIVHWTSGYEKTCLYVYEIERKEERLVSESVTRSLFGSYENGVSET